MHLPDLNADFKLQYNNGNCLSAS